MMMVRFAAGVLALSLVLVTACTSDEDCNGDLIDTTGLEEQYACDNTLFDLGFALPVEAGFTIISTQAEFDAQIAGTCQVEVDFAKWDLVIGKQQLERMPAGVSYSYRRACPLKRYEMRVVFELGTQVVSPIVTYHLLVPKIAEDEVVDVRIEMD